MDTNKQNQDNMNPNQGKSPQQNWDKDKNDPNQQQQGGQQQTGQQQQDQQKKSQQPEHNVHDQERKRA